MDNIPVFKAISGELSKIWNYSWIPVSLDPKTFSELTRANELALKIIAEQYREGHYENNSHPFTHKISCLDDPEISIVPFRIDYLKKRDGTFAMYDLNTQPGVPGSFFWEEFWRQRGTDRFIQHGKELRYFRIFPILGDIFKDHSGDRPRIAMFQERDPMMGKSTLRGLTTICEKTSSFGYYNIDFVQERDDLEGYHVIEPFYFIRGDVTKVFSNYTTALKTGRPLASNLKLEPYTSKDMSFATNMESYLDSGEGEFLRERIAFPSKGDGVKKRLYGMSGTGYYDGNDSIPWSKELVCQERLFPERCQVSRGKDIIEMMYDVGITSIMVFRGCEMVDFHPVVDITIRAKEEHPISGPDTNVVPAAVEI